MASLKIPLQIVCPNCQQGNLPGSPYCSGCGAPLSEVPPGTASVSRADMYTGEVDAIGRFLNEGQDRGLVKQSYERAFAILTSGESIEYIAVAGRANLAHSPDCVIATSKRIILLRKKVLGKYELDDCYWRDVRSAVLREMKNGVSLSLEAIQGWHITVESLPKAQAWRLHEIALQRSERLRESAGERSSSSSGLSAPVPASSSSTQTGSLSLPGSTLSGAMQAASNASFEAQPAAMPAPSAAPVPTQPAISAKPVARPGTGGLGHPAALGRFDVQGGLESEKPGVLAPSFVPTPESVLQSILQQSQGASDGAPTRPIQFAAAAFQAPATADAQHVTLHETTTDPHMRQAPPMPTLEQIAVFSGPLGFNHLSSSDVSAAVDQHTASHDTRATSEQSSQWPQSVPLSGDFPKPSASWLQEAQQVRESVERDRLSAHQAENSSIEASRPNSKKSSTKETRNKPPQLPDDLDTPGELADVIGYMLPGAPNLMSGPLPLPGSLTSGPLLPATPSSSNNTELFSQTTDDDNETLATQLLNFDPTLESDADRPTDINLGQYAAENSQGGRSGKHATASSSAKSTSGRNSGAGSSGRSPQSKTGGDDPISKMKQLKMLLDAGFITDADYEAKKADILARFF